MPFISEPPHGNYVVDAFALQLFPESGYGHGDGVFVDVFVRTPHAVYKLLLGEYPVGVKSERVEQFEFLVREVEKLARYARFEALRGFPHPREILKHAWNSLLDSMDHNQNGIGGECADTEKKEMKLHARLTAERLARESAMILAARIPAPRKNCFPLVIFNRLSWKRKELVRARTSLYGPGSARHPQLGENNFRLIDDRGKEVPFRLVRHLRMVADSIEVEFQAEVPAFGCRAWFLEIADPCPVSSPFRIDDGNVRDLHHPNCAAGETTVESPLLRLTINRITHPSGGNGGTGTGKHDSLEMRFLCASGADLSFPGCGRIGD